MNKKKPSLVRQMWWHCISQLVMSISITMSCIFASLILLNSTKDDNQDFARLTPRIRQHLQEEQDPDKLRQMATGLLDETVSEAEFREKAMRFVVKVSAGYGCILCICSLSSGIWAYKLQRQNREKDSPSR